MVATGCHRRNAASADLAVERGDPRHAVGKVDRVWPDIAQVGAALGAAGAWPVVTQVFNATWSVDWPVILGILGGTTALGALGGALAAFAALSRRPAAVLREAG